MFLNHFFFVAACVSTLALTAAGCGGNDAKHPASAADAIDDHAHPSEGPHGGSLTELGNEEYHAEIVHDDAAGTVTIYMLDSAAKEMVPIESTELTINLKHDGRGEQFKLMASADTSDPAGMSSRFVSTDKELAEDLDHDGSEPQLVVTINGKQYRGAIAHDHDEEQDHEIGHDNAAGHDQDNGSAN